MARKNANAALVRAVEVLPPQDGDAIEIGDLYRKGKSSMAESVRYLIEAGRMLKAKQDSLNHGEWLPWLEANEEALGFGERTARMLMRGSNRKLTSDLTEEKALQISREIWGNVPARRLTTAELLTQSNQNDWRTPRKYLDAARAVMGAIDLDPASSAEANETVRATRFYTEADDGLRQPWRGCVWLNPPYGGDARLFVERLVRECQVGNVTAACALLNSHPTETRWFQELFEYAICFVKGRIDFGGPSREVSSTSTHGSAIVYLGRDIKRFIKKFSDFGAVVGKLNADEITTEQSDLAEPDHDRLLEGLKATADTPRHLAERDRRKAALEGKQK